MKDKVVDPKGKICFFFKVKAKGRMLTLCSIYCPNSKRNVLETFRGGKHAFGKRFKLGLRLKLRFIWQYEEKFLKGLLNTQFWNKS